MDFPRIQQGRTEQGHIGGPGRVVIITKEFVTQRAVLTLVYFSRKEPNPLPGQGGQGLIQSYRIEDQISAKR